MKGLQSILNAVEAKYSKNKVVEFRAGDNVKVHLKVKEGEKERVQVFEGTVIARGNEGIKETFRVRRISYGVGVERIFPVHSPSIVKVDVTKKGDVNRAKLYYLKGKSRKDARITELRDLATDATGQVQSKAEVVPPPPPAPAEAAPASEPAKA